ELPRHLTVGHALRHEPDHRQLRVGESLPAGLRTPGRDQPPTDTELAQPPTHPGFVARCAGFGIDLEGAPEARDGLVAIVASNQRDARVLERRRERDRSRATLEVLDRVAQLPDVAIDEP